MPSPNTLIARHAPDRLAPATDSPEYPEYLQWLHFAESSGILPLLLDMFVRKDGSPMRFLPDYAKAECAKVLGYLDEVLANRRYLVADRLTGADILNSFLVDLLAQSGQLAQFPHLRPTGSDSTPIRPARGGGAGARAGPDCAGKTGSLISGSMSWSSMAWGARNIFGMQPLSPWRILAMPTPIWLEERQWEGPRLLGALSAGCAYCLAELAGLPAGPDCYPAAPPQARSTLLQRDGVVLQVLLISGARRDQRGRERQAGRATSAHLPCLRQARDIVITPFASLEARSPRSPSP